MFIHKEERIFKITENVPERFR